MEVTKSLTPGQAFIKVVHEELVRLMGEPSAGLNLRAQRPVVVMLAGLQGAGKTTTAGKLARWLIEKQRKKVLLVSTDVYRPAAIAAAADPRRAGGRRVRAGATPTKRRSRSRGARSTEATLQAYDVLLIDTAGPPARRRRDDGRGERARGGAAIRTSGCSSSTAWPARMPSTPPRRSTRP